MEREYAVNSFFCEGGITLNDLVTDFFISFLDDDFLSIQN